MCVCVHICMYVCMYILITRFVYIYLVVDGPCGEGEFVFDVFRNERLELVIVVVSESGWIQRQEAHVGSQHQEGERHEGQRTRHLERNRTQSAC